MGPSFLLVKDTKKRIHDIIDGSKSLIFLPITLSILFLSVIFAFKLINEIPVLNLSWLGYNIAVGPYAETKGFIGILPFLPFLIYALIHMNYFEEYYFRSSFKRVIVWAFLHMIMGVSLGIVLLLLPIGMIYKIVYDRYGVNYSYALHFMTNISIISISLAMFFLYDI